MVDVPHSSIEVLSDEELEALGFDPRILSDEPTAGPYVRTQVRSRGAILARSLTSTHSRNLTEFSGWILRALPDGADREMFSNRITKWLSGIRRGKPRFPLRFPEEVRALSNMSKTQVRRSIYDFQNRELERFILNKNQTSYFQQVMPAGRIRTRNTNIGVLEWQRRKVKPLPRSCWPRLGTKPAWPCTPTFAEMVEMSRRGKTTRPMQFNAGQDTVQHCLSSAQVRADPDLCRSIVRQQFVAVRADTRISDKYLKYFRYRWDFLVLTADWCIPIGLARELVRIWRTDPYSLWLRDKCSFKCYLKKTPITDFVCRLEGPW